MRRWLNRTPQSVDPIGGVVDAPVVAIGAFITTLLAVWLTIAHWRDVRIPIAALLGVLLVAAAAIALYAATLPVRAPFTPERLGLIITLAVGAAIAEYVSTAGANRFLYDDYGPIAIGLLILLLSPYCSWVTLVISGLLASGVGAILVIGAAPTTATGAPVVSLVVVNAAMILSMTAAAAVYSASIVREVQKWQRETNRSMLRRDAEAQAEPPAAGLSAAQPSRVSVLRSEVLPFLARVTTAEHISREDADRARELVGALRQALRAGVEATWLDDLAEQVAVTSGVPVEVTDRDGDAALFDDHQRAAVTALVGWLAEGERSRGLRVVVARVGGESVVRLRVVAARSAGWTPKRRDLDRFVAIARVVGLRARVLQAGENVTVEIDDVIG